MSSRIKTVRQERIETCKRGMPNQARRTPAIKAKAPAKGEVAAVTIAGKVITARVT